MRLAGTVIGVLADDHDFDLVKAGGIKGGKPLVGWWINSVSCLHSGDKKCAQFDHIIAGELISQNSLPTGLKADAFGGCGRG